MSPGLSWSDPARTAAGKLLAAVALGALACTEVSLEPRPATDNNADSLLTIEGRICPAAPDASGFPVKVVMVVDQSGSMCISDPPGSQESPGFCERLVEEGIVPPDLTEPARVRALRQLAAQFAGQPNVEVAVVPFETNVRPPWPAVTSGNRFARPDATLDTYLGQLQAQLGKGTDYQGAMAYTYSLIASDIERTAANNPSQLPRTRYVVVFLTDGTPYPRCSANDNLAVYADPWSPHLTWADSSSAAEFCNLLDPDSPDNIEGFVPGTDRNQNYQILSYVERLMELGDTHNVGDIRVHTVLLFNQAAVEACGSICQDIYGTYPNVAPGDYPEAAHAIARWTLEQIAQFGNGVFQEFIDGDIQNLGLGALDYTSLYSPNVLKRLILQNLTATPDVDRRAVDSDGDGISDDLDNGFTHGTSSFQRDSDADCLSDGFEVLRIAEGFSPIDSADVRGCVPLTTSGRAFCDGSDTDGDGLSDCEEIHVKSHTGLVDSDADGIPDGLEVHYGLDPRARNAHALDTDGDGRSDALELLADVDPTRPDGRLFEAEGYQYELRPVRSGGRDCYDYAITNVRMVSPPPRAGRRTGTNLFKLWFAEAPASGVTTDYGVWRTACYWTRYAPPGIRQPLGPTITLDDGHFRAPWELNDEADYLANCRGDP